MIRDVEKHFFQSLPDLQSDRGLMKALNAVGIIRIPTLVYQMMADCINTAEDLDVNQRRIRNLLTGFVQEEYPECHLSSFIEFTIDDCKKISPYLQWGFYIHLLPKNNSLPAPSIEDTIKRLTFGSTPR